MAGILAHGAKFHGLVETHRMTVPQFKFICTVNGCDFGGNPGEYFQMDENAVFECCGEPAALAEKVNVTIWKDGADKDGKQDGAFLQTWEIVEEPVTLAQYRAIYNAAQKRG